VLIPFPIEVACGAYPQSALSMAMMERGQRRQVGRIGIERHLEGSLVSGPDSASFVELLCRSGSTSRRAACRVGREAGDARHGADGLRRIVLLPRKSLARGVEGWMWVSSRPMMPEPGVDGVVEVPDLGVR
jgi:hypothetical protein